MFTIIIATSMAQAGGLTSRTIFGMESADRAPITMKPVMPVPVSTAIAPAKLDDSISQGANDTKRAAQPGDNRRS